MKNVSENTKKLLKIANELLLMVALAMVLYNLVNASDFAIIVSAALLLALISAALYYLFGSKKDAAGYYSIFIALFALSRLFQTIGAAMNGNVAGAVAAALIYGALCVLFTAKDLGVKKTMILGAVIFGISVVNLIITLASGGSIYWIFVAVTDVILSMVVNVMILAKYEDKSERGRR